jgi:virginiamycin B lyase
MSRCPRSIILPFRRTSLAISLVAAMLLILGVAVPAGAGQKITEFPVPTGGARPYSIVAAPDGNLYFTESDGNKIGRISPDGHIKEFDLPNAGSEPYDIVVGTDGALWFTERFGNRIGRMTLTGQFTEYPVPTQNSQPWGIAAGKDGSIWFAEENVDQIGQVSPLGYITEIPLATETFPTYIAAGPDGAVWFTEEIGDVIGRITQRPGGLPRVKLFPVPTTQALPWKITAGPDHALWFTELSGRQIGRITTDGVVTEFPVPGDFGGIDGITVGFDGRLWFTENDLALVGSITTSGQVRRTFPTGEFPNLIAAGADGNLWFTESSSASNAIAQVLNSTPGDGYVLVFDVGFGPRSVTVALGGRATWLFQGPSRHSVVDQSVGLFDSGPQPIGTLFFHRYTAAGSYPYADGLDPSLKGRVVVPIEVPASASVGTPFTVTWAVAPPEGTIAFDVEVLTPGATDWAPWQEGTTELSADYTAGEAGTYQFRARVRIPATPMRSEWSPAGSVAVA